MRRVLLAASIVTLLGGCIESVEVLPLAITMEAAPLSPTPGATVTFDIAAQGRDLVHIELNYGDGTLETRVTSGANTAQLHRQHVYAAAGTYQAVATAVELRGGTKSATVTIAVQ